MHIHMCTCVSTDRVLGSRRGGGGGGGGGCKMPDSLPAKVVILATHRAGQCCRGYYYLSAYTSAFSLVSCPTFCREAEYRCTQIQQMVGTTGSNYYSSPVPMRPGNEATITQVKCLVQAHTTLSRNLQRANLYAAFCTALSRIMSSTVGLKKSFSTKIPTVIGNTKCSYSKFCRLVLM